MLTPGAASRLLNYTSRRAPGARRAGRQLWFVGPSRPLSRVRVAGVVELGGVARLFPRILILGE